MSDPIPLRRPANEASTGTLPETAPKAVPDLLLEGEVFWNRYKLPLIGVLAVVLAGLVGSELYRSNQQKSLAAAAAELDSAKTIADYKNIISRHEGSPAAADAALLSGRMQMDAKDYAGAADTWKTFADKFPQHPLAPNALMGVAGALEAQGKMDEARAIYQRIETSYANLYLAPLASLAEAALLKSQGKLADARRIYENLIASAPQSDTARQATQSLRLLKAVPSLPVDTKPAAPEAAASPAVVAPALPGVLPAAPSPAAANSPAPAETAPVPVPVAPTPAPSAAALPAGTPAVVIPVPPAATPASVPVVPAATPAPVPVPVIPTATPTVAAPAAAPSPTPAPPTPVPAVTGVRTPAPSTAVLVATPPPMAPLTSPVVPAATPPPGTPVPAAAVIPAPSATP